jgi:hypothetical protein
VVAVKNGVVVPHAMLVAPAKNRLAGTQPAEAQDIH